MLRGPSLTPAHGVALAFALWGVIILAVIVLAGGR
jgi:hypothetical protein